MSFLGTKLGFCPREAPTKLEFMEKQHATSQTPCSPFCDDNGLPFNFDCLFDSDCERRATPVSAKSHLVRKMSDIPVTTLCEPDGPTVDTLQINYYATRPNPHSNVAANASKMSDYEKIRFFLDMTKSGLAQLEREAENLFMEHRLDIHAPFLTQKKRDFLDSHIEKYNTNLAQRKKLRR